MGISVSDTKPDAKMAMAMVIANSYKKRPTIPGIKKTGMNTATKETVIEMTVNEISRDPLNAASLGDNPCSRFAIIFSKTIMASSIINPVDSVRASSVKLLRLKFKKYIAENVIKIEMGRLSDGMIVA